MSLASLFQPLQPLAPPRQQPPPRAGWQLVSASQGPPPPAPVGGPVGGPTRIPYDEFGLDNNSSGPLHVGDVPKPGTAAANVGNSPAPTSGSGGGGGGGYDWNSTDPILMQIRAHGQQMISNAESAGLANRKQAEIGYGYDPNYSYADAGTAEAAKQNAFSTLAQLLYNHGERAQGLDESLNKSNLFYSGTRAKEIGREGRQYTLEQSNANQGLQQRLSEITNSILQTKLAAQGQEIQGESDAYNRYLQYLLQNGLDPGSGGGAPAGGGGGSSSGGGSGGLPGRPTDTSGTNASNLTVKGAGQSNPQPSWGDWDKYPPGTRLVARKFAGGPGQGSDTRWVPAG